MRTRVGPNSEDSIDGLLSSFRDAGQLESQGVFTLAGRKAAGKLAKSLLPDPADWILKIVQCACRARCAELRVNQTRKATHIAFRFPFLLDVRALESSLTQGLDASQVGVNELSSALRVVGLGQDRSWVARLETEETTHWVVVNGGEVSLETVTGGRHEPGVTNVLIGIAFPPGQAGKVGYLLRFGAAVQIEHEALLARTRACPIPLYLDGMRLDNLQRHEATGSFERESFLGVIVGQSLDQNPIPLPAGISQSDGATGMGERFTDLQPFYFPPTRPSRTGSSLIRFSFRYIKEPHARAGRKHKFRALASPSRVHLVRHGVVVGKRNLGITEAIAVDLYLSADDETGGLSGLEVEVRSEHLQSARAEIGGSGDFLRGLQTELRDYQIRPSHRQLAVCGGGSGVAVALAPWPFKLLAVGASVVHLANSARQYQRILADCRSEVSNFQMSYCADPISLEG